MTIRVAYVLLAIRLAVVTYQVHALPYAPDSNGKCNDSITEYLPEGLNLCCKRCSPGMRFRQQCSATSETECGPCPTGQYMESFNYNKNCFKCTKCIEDRGLRYAQTCTSTKSSKCVCQTGQYCTVEFNHPTCQECKSYTSCQPGYGVSTKGSGDSDVECVSCPDGTFSDSLSYNDTCQKHTDCKAERRILRFQGNATSDSVCEPQVRGQNNKPPTTTHPSTPASSTTVAPPGPSSTLSSTLSSDRLSEPKTTEVKTVDSYSTATLVLSILGAAGAVVFLVAIVVLVTGKVTCNQKKEYKPDELTKTDSNGNCKEVTYNSDPQFISATFNSTSAEQQCLLKTGHCNNISQAQPPCDGSLSLQESMTTSGSPLHSTPPLVTYLTQPTPHPTSPLPQVTPLPSSPQVNVNITFNVPLNLEMGNGSCVTPRSPPTDSSHSDLTGLDVPLGAEEECVSLPQQEDGKEVCVAVQEKGHAAL